MMIEQRSRSDVYFNMENAMEVNHLIFLQEIWPGSAQTRLVIRKQIGKRNLCMHKKLIETLKIAFVSTGLGFILSLPLATLASRNLHRDSVAIPFRFLLSAMRTLPSLIWAIFFVITIST